MILVLLIIDTYLSFCLEFFVKWVHVLGLFPVLQKFSVNVTSISVMAVPILAILIDFIIIDIQISFYDWLALALIVTSIFVAASKSLTKWIKYKC